MGIGLTLATAHLHQRVRTAERGAAAERSLSLLAERMAQQFAIATSAAALLPQRTAPDGFEPAAPLRRRLLREAALLRTIYTVDAGGRVTTHYSRNGTVPESAYAARALERLRAQGEDAGQVRLLGVAHQGSDAVYLLPLGPTEFVVAGLGLAAALENWTAELARGLDVSVAGRKGTLHISGKDPGGDPSAFVREVRLANLMLKISVRSAVAPSLHSFEIARAAILAGGLLTSLVAASLAYLVHKRARSVRERARQSEHSLEITRGAFKMAPTPLLVFDRHGKFIETSSRWWQASGLPESGIDSVSQWLDLTRAHAESDSELLDLPNLKAYSGTISLRDATGDERIWQIASSPIAPPGATEPAYVMIANDVTTTRATRIELEQTNSELNAFVYIASHDLRSPLRAIKSLAQWIMEDSGDALPTHARDDLHTLLLRVDVMEALLADLLEYSRIGRRAEQLADVSIEEIVEELRLSLDLSHGATLRAQGTLPVLRAPRAAVRRVFGNLIDNALKHGARDDLSIVVSCRREGGFWTFFIDDDGEGVAPQYREKIFGMFERLSTTRNEGSGMGLALVKKTVEIHGGSIAADTNAAGGARFVVRWPSGEKQRAGE